MTNQNTTDGLGYNVKNFMDPDKLRRDMSFSTNDLSTAMMEQSSLFAHYGVLAAKASRQVDAVKMLLESTEAAIYKAVRAKMESEGKKPTEMMLDKAIAQHPRAVALKRALAEAKEVESISKVAVDGFRHRRDMLIQQGFIMREEMKGETRVSARNLADEQHEAQKERVLAGIRAKDTGN